MARVSSFWKKIGDTIEPVFSGGVNILIRGTDRYLNFGTTEESAGYGIRDNAGVMEFKDDSGSWAPFSTGGGGGITTEQAVDAVAAAMALGTNTGITITYDDAGNAISIALADEAFTTAMKDKVDFITVTGAINLDDIVSYPSVDQTKVGHISVTQAVDLDQMETDIAALANGMVYKDDWDASAGSFPGGGVAQIGWFYNVSVAGTVDSVEFSVGDSIIAKADNASTTTYAANWTKKDQTDAVQSVVGLVGTITKSGLLAALNVEDGATANSADATLLARANHTGTQLASTISDFAATVRGTVLTGLSTGTATAVTAADSVLVAIGKLQAQVTDRLPLAGGTMTGDILLGTGTSDKSSIILNDSALADESWSGTTVKGTAGATIAVGDLCYLNADDSRWELVDANLSDGYDKMLGICVDASTDGAATEMLIDGLIASAAFPALTVGSPVYMSETAGDIVVAQPTTADVAIRVLGYATSATILHFRPSFDYIVHV